MNVCHPLPEPLFEQHEGVGHLIARSGLEQKDGVHVGGSDVHVCEVCITLIVGVAHGNLASSKE